jgi:hypothetical protein
MNAPAPGAAREAAAVTAAALALAGHELDPFTCRPFPKWVAASSRVTRP